MCGAKRGGASISPFSVKNLRKNNIIKKEIINSDDYKLFLNKIEYMVQNNNIKKVYLYKILYERFSKKKKININKKSK